MNVQYSKTGYLPVQRQVRSWWHRYSHVDPVVLIPLDRQVTTIVANAEAVQVARGSTSSDADGSRQATLIFQPGTSATMVLSDGSQRPLASLNVRATEYTVGASGPAAMPATLPRASAYTYCAELSVDEALQAGAETVVFSRPVALYVENFLRFPTGRAVPAGFFDRRKGVWVAVPNGRVVTIAAIADGIASLDVTGDGAADDPQAHPQLAITADELRMLGSLYSAGASLWRVQVPHFSPYDLNWPSISMSIAPPPLPKPKADKQPDDACRIVGSVIECQSQALGESIPIAGTGLSLRYLSSRVPGRVAARTIEVTMTEASVSAALQEVQLNVEVAGQRHSWSFAPAANLKHVFTWDGKDVYGRDINGIQHVRVNVTYGIDALYNDPLVRDGSSFGSPGGTVTFGATRLLGIFTREALAPARPWDARASGLGGWTVDVHHALDGEGNAVLFGSGTKRSDDSAAGIITRAAGKTPTPSTLACIESQSGQSAIVSELLDPRNLVAAGDGSLYFTNCAGVKRVDLSGRIWHVAGAGPDSGEGVPAATASLNTTALAPSRDGSLYVAEPTRIRRITADGLIRTIAGSATAGFSGDGGPALGAQFNFIRALAFAPDGSLYVWDSLNARIRRIATDGTISTYAGGGPVVVDDVPATQTSIYVTGMEASPDGDLYILTGTTIRRVGSDGIVRRIATLGNSPYSGGRDLAVAPDATLYAAVTEPPTNSFPYGFFAIYRLFTGRDPELLFRASYGPGFSIAFPNPSRYLYGDDGPAGAAGFNEPSAIAVGPDGALYIADTANRVVRRVSISMARRSGSETYIPSADGLELFYFDHEGRHLRTVHGLTGGVLYTFGYDSKGRLERVTNADGLITAVERDVTGQPAAIVAPNGDRTILRVEGNGFLSAVSAPGGIEHQMTYVGKGLLSGFTNPRGRTHAFSYDPLGRLILDTDPAGGRKELAQSRTSADAYAVTVRTALGRTTEYRSDLTALNERRRGTTDSSGVSTESVLSVNQASSVTTFADGSNVTNRISPDPRLGVLSPVINVSLLLPSGRTFGAIETRSISFSSGIAPFNFASITSTLRIGSGTYTSTFVASTRRVTTRTPLGRVIGQVLDAAGRPTAIEVPGFQPVSLVYDGRGRTAMIQQGNRSFLFGYDERDQLISLTDPLSRATQFEYDAAGRPVKQILPGGRVVTLAYDANGNLISITPAGRPAHLFSYTPVDLTDGYTPPPVTGGGAGTVLYEYSPDRELTSITNPGGTRVTLTYDGGGRMQSLATVHDSHTYTYDAAGRLASATAASGQHLSYAYDGSLPASVAAAGMVRGSVSWTYDDELRVRSESVGSSAVDFSYDTDSLLTKAGALTLTRNAQNGLLTGTSLGNITDAFVYNEFGEMTGYSAAYGGSALLALSYSRDGAGRITAIGAQGYEYDAAGRLKNLVRDGAVVTRYEYDPNGNRTLKATANGGTAASYDVQDRLQTYGAASYTYTANGELRTKSDPSGTTSYDYDALGNLRKVTLPGGMAIEYVIDGENRRVGKKVNGTLTQGWLYAGKLRIVAELDGGNNVVSRFVYGSRSNVPDYMIKAGVTYRLLSDHLGSPRLVVNVADGTIAQQIEYDEFGKVLSDSHPGFTPFGFAGGLYDRETGLVRFGARDYDPHTGRWTSKDPIGFGGGDTNLYAYAGDDPINLIDPSGLLFGGTIDAGEAYGEAALESYADVLADPDAAWYEKAGAAAGGFFSALWTPCTSDSTFAVLSTAAGGAGGLRAAGSKAAGREFSHWIPDRALKRTGSKFLRNTFGKSPANGNFVTSIRHYLHDPHRMLRGTTRAGKFPPLVQQLDRMPRLLYGTGSGAAVGGAALFSGSGCGCS